LEWILAVFVKDVRKSLGTAGQVMGRAGGAYRSSGCRTRSFHHGLAKAADAAHQHPSKTKRGSRNRLLDDSFVMLGDKV
jgi:hypothetical protein